MKSAEDRKKRTYIIVLLGALYIFWGGTYLGMKIAIETMPPFMMAGIRFIISGSVLYGIARLTGTRPPEWKQCKNAGYVGMMLLGSNGLIAWSEQFVPSGIAALVVATVPLWIMLLGWFSKSSSRPGVGVAAGVLLGLAGIGILVIKPGEAAGVGSINPLGLLAVLCGAFMWSVGSLYSRNAKLPDFPLMSTAIQMLAGGTMLLLISFILGEWSRVDIAGFSLRSYIALGYLIFFGSVIGYSSYIWLLKNAEPAWVSTYAFVNPVVAVFLGWAVVGEPLTRNTLVAAAVIVGSVVIITVFKDKGKSGRKAENCNNLHK